MNGAQWGLAKPRAEKESSMKKNLAVLSVLLAALSAGIASAETNPLPKKLICPLVSDRGASDLSQELVLGDRLSEDSKKHGEYTPGPAIYSKKDGMVTFSYLNCDGSGSYTFSLAELQKAHVSPDEVRGAATAEVREEGVSDLRITCKAIYE